jgi:REP element-mobilizing transposase RayT
MDRLRDAQRTGPAYLQIGQIAEIVVRAIHRGAERHYLLHAWVVMPNHVHLLLTPRVAAAELLRRLKGSSAREANLALQRVGRAWRCRLRSIRGAGGR